MLKIKQLHTLPVILGGDEYNIIATSNPTTGEYIALQKASQQFDVERAVALLSTVINGWDLPLPSPQEGGLLDLDPEDFVTIFAAVIKGIGREGANDPN